MGRSSPNAAQDRNCVALLQALRGAASLVRAGGLRTELATRGIALSDRSVRLYLAELRAHGLAAAEGRRGYRLTEAGRSALQASTALGRLGLPSQRIAALGYAMDLDLRTRRGRLAVDAGLSSIGALRAGADAMVEFFRRGHAPGELVGLLAPGDRIGEVVVPEGAVGVCTVCAATVSGLLLKRGIPARPLFGGLLDLAGGRPSRFSELVHYDATTVDPLEVFVHAGLADPLGVLGSGGRMGAGFLEIPAESRGAAVRLSEELGPAGLGAILGIGAPGLPLFEAPVEERHAGVAVAGGLNPFAVLAQAGQRVWCRAFAGLFAYERMFHCAELPDRLSALARRLPGARPDHPGGGRTGNGVSSPR